MKKILVVMVLTLLLCACEASEVSNGRKTYKEYFQKTLKDPNSLIIYSEKYEETIYGITWTLDVGARNSYGAMIRINYIIETIGSQSIIWVKRNYEDLGQIDVDEL
ncbi:hypothetical protein [Bacteroides nordii]|uniref:hypothetical protein n=1 Tax=Bacteroides nordii TaxID=291645 RepID=UPI0018AB88A5|nr:hypothetical protein [Bacteroides nordii]